MENRFGIKDLFLFLLMCGLIAVVALAMVMFDRQYEQIMLIKRQNDQLTRDVVDIRRQLAEGITAVAPTTGPASTQSGPNLPDSFRPMKEAEKMPQFARGGWFLDNFSTKIGRLTPLVSSDIYETWVEYLVMEGLAVRDPDTADFAPRLARSWEISEDGLRMRFLLRRGITFSDGAPFTADDVVWTFKWILNPQVNAARARSYFTKLKDVTKIDDYTVEFIFNEFYFGNFEQVATTSIMPKHFYERFTPDQFNEKTGLMMGTGPYRLEDPENWTPGKLVQLLRNERYWGVPATFDRVIFREIESESTEMVMYGNQEFDLVRCTPPMYHKMMADPRLVGMSNTFEYTNVFGGYLYCGWNELRKQNGQERPTVFADKRIRQAMTMLLDRERMCKEIFFGYASPATGPFPPTSPQYDQSVKAWPHDEAAAKKLLLEAGCKETGSGVLNKPDGMPFTFKLTYPSGSETWEQVVLFMKDNFGRAGIVLEPDRVDWPVLVDKLNNSNFEAVTLGWSGQPEDDPYQVFHSDAIKDQGDNRVSYRNPELDKVIEKARTTVDRGKRMELWHQVHRILHEDQPYTFLFDRKALRFFNKRIQNVRVSKLGLNFENLNPDSPIPWFIPTHEQRMTR